MCAALQKHQRVRGERDDKFREGTPIADRDDPADGRRDVIRYKGKAEPAQ